MRILLWHGYLLRGSGSNIYTANVARAWREQGHDVMILCQEGDVDGLDFIDAIGDFEPGNTGFSAPPTGVPGASGRCRVVRPDIGGLLPVYVYDAYEGFQVKRFVDLTDDELEAYTSANVDALVVALSRHQPHAIITGHEVMGPEIARRACEPTGHAYIAKLHGSALEYAVKEQERYLQHATSGLGAARWVVGGSDYMIEEAARTIPGFKKRAVVVNPGCDVDLFRPHQWKDPQPAVAYVGKLIAAKGVHNLLAALPLLSVRGLRCVVVGYGGFEEGLRALATALHEGDVEEALMIANGEAGELAHLAAFLTDARDDPQYWARASKTEIEFTGRLDHPQLAEVLPDMDMLVVPSVVPEAFGMVAAEGAASGVLPLVPNHSGISEVGRALEDALDAPGLLTFDSSDPVRSIAAGIDRILALSPQDRSRYEMVVAETARLRWSWAHTAEKLLELTQ